MTVAYPETDLYLEPGDSEKKDITEDTYLIRELAAESIDLMEVAVAINSRFKIKVTDNVLFLRKLRIYVSEAKESDVDTIQFVAEQYPYLKKERIEEIVADLEAGPVLKTEDLVNYIEGSMQ